MHRDRVLTAGTEEEGGWANPRPRRDRGSLFVLSRAPCGGRVCCQEELGRGGVGAGAGTGVEAEPGTGVGWAGLGHKWGSMVRMAQEMELGLQPASSALSPPHPALSSLSL